MIYKILSIFSYFLFFPVFLLGSCILIIISFIYLPFLYILDKLFCRILLSTLFIFPKINGHFPNSGTFIIMMNHSSFIDAFIFPLIPKGFYTGLTAAINFKIPIFSTLIRRINAIPIERNNLKSAIKSIKKAESVLKQGIHIGILPEGTRTLTGTMGPLKKGGFHMAINTKTSIIPIGISGAFSFKPKNRWWILPGKIHINIGSPINVQDFKTKDIDTLINLVANKLKELSGENNENS